MQKNKYYFLPFGRTAATEGEGPDHAAIVTALGIESFTSEDGTALAPADIAKAYEAKMTTAVAGRLGEDYKNKIKEETFNGGRKSAIADFEKRMAEEFGLDPQKFEEKGRRVAMIKAFKEQIKAAKAAGKNDNEKQLREQLDLLNNEHKTTTEKLKQYQEQIDNIPALQAQARQEARNEYDIDRTFDGLIAGTKNARMNPEELADLFRFRHLKNVDLKKEKVGGKDVINVYEKDSTRQLKATATTNHTLQTYFAANITPYLKQSNGGEGGGTPPPGGNGGGKPAVLPPGFIEKYG